MLLHQSPWLSCDVSSGVSQLSCSLSSFLTGFLQCCLREGFGGGLSGTRMQFGHKTQFSRLALRFPCQQTRLKLVLLSGGGCSLTGKRKSCFYKTEQAGEPIVAVCLGTIPCEHALAAATSVELGASRLVSCISRLNSSGLQPHF